MKKILCSVSVIVAIMLLLPLTAMKKNPDVAAVYGAKNDVKASENQKDQSDSFSVLYSESGKTVNMTAEEYITGVVSAEMPALYDAEALKAQAVAAYSYACYRRSENTSNDYDITTDHTVDQSFITSEDANKRWGEKADEYSEKIKSAVSEALEYNLTYNGNPVLSVYHAISSGKTESCLNIWGKDLPYLTSVDSPGDKLSPDYISTLTVSDKEFAKKLKEKCELTGASDKWCGKCTKTDAGAVSEIVIGKTTVSGSDIRKLFGLRSADFKIDCKDGSFTFTVYGYGHGVGMSQYGANYMAKQGKNFKEILTHYYPGCKVEKQDS